MVIHRQGVEPTLAKAIAEYRPHLDQEKINRMLEYNIVTAYQCALLFGVTIHRVYYMAKTFTVKTDKTGRKSKNYGLTLIHPFSIVATDRAKNKIALADIPNSEKGPAFIARDRKFEDLLIYYLNESMNKKKRKEAIDADK